MVSIIRELPLLDLTLMQIMRYVVVHMGFSDKGSPIGIQLETSVNSDTDPLYFTRLISSLVPGFQKPEMN